ncbi:MAG: hypothetical protein H7Y88_13515 [Phycisphaerales bacterium]|nr:hypothetical protein [Phycisphaerales bacterium]
MAARSKGSPRSPAALGAVLRAALVVLVLSAPGCITERTPIRPGGGGGGGGMMIRDPTAPARPTAGASTTVSRIQADIKRLGLIPFDGLTLPLTSHDGRWIATQHGPVPSWEAILGFPGSDLSASTRISLFAVSDSAITPAPGDPSVPRGVMLGRAADDHGFLVESPRPDGERWIGKADWATGDITWLVQEHACAAHAVFLSDGSLAFTRTSLPPATSRSELVVLGPAGEPRGTYSVEGGRGGAGATLAFPLPVGDTPQIAVFALRPRRMELVVIGPPGYEAPATSGAQNERDDQSSSQWTVVSRLPLTAAAGTLSAAYAATAAMNQPVWHGMPGKSAHGRGDGERENRGAGCIAFFDAATSRVVLFWPGEEGRGGTIRPLAPGSSSAVPMWGVGRAGSVVGAEGWVAATPKSLIFQRMLMVGDNAQWKDRELWQQGGDGMTVLNQGYLPRLTTFSGAYLLFAPASESSGSELEVSLTKMRQAVPGGSETPFGGSQTPD